MLHTWSNVWYEDFNSHWETPVDFSLPKISPLSSHTKSKSLHFLSQSFESMQVWCNNPKINSEGQCLGVT